MSLDYCGGCNAFIEPGKYTLFNNNAYCHGCFAGASRASLKLKQPQPQGSIQMLPRVAPNEPVSPKVGDVWVDSTDHKIRVFTGQTWMMLSHVDGEGVATLIAEDALELNLYQGEPKEMSAPEIVHMISGSGSTYKNPSDFAGRQKGDVYVLRRWRVGVRGAEADAKVSAYDTDLEAVRMHVPPGLTCMAAGPSDDPAILETWF